MRTLTSPPQRRRQPRAACDEPPRLFGEEPPSRPVAAVTVPATTTAAPVAAGPTLESLISGAWEGLAASAAVACPLCAAEMQPRWSAGSGVVGGRCGGCGTTLE